MKSVLALNAGSSSIKFSLFPADAEQALLDGAIDGIGGDARFHVRDCGGKPIVDNKLGDAKTHETALKALLSWFESQQHSLSAVGHRVVHGGAHYTSPVLVTADVLRELRALIPLAPLHEPHNIAAIEAVAKLHPDLPQVACFDTAFHAGESALATAFALPHAITDLGVRRYGFHGLSYEYIASVLPKVCGPDVANGRIVVAHLGNGASLCAMHARRSVATTMSFTALDGLVMGTRSGALDPGVVLYLLQEQHMSADAISDLLYNRSGLLGVSGLSSDMRDLLASSSKDAAAAVDLFVYRLSLELGSMAAALGGLDALVFTGGIGENAAVIRSRVCEAASWLGIVLDDAGNAANGPCISASKVSAWVVPTNEDLMIARHTLAVVQV
jgi:acetate kinase